MLTYITTKRIFDIVASVFLMCISAPTIVFIAALIKTNENGPAIYWSDRVGIGNTIFKMPKFRTMRLDTPPVATHLMEDPNQWISRIGHLLRKFSLDELPQLYSVFRGDMSFVGPRPALFNQDDLVELRTRKGIHRIVPGITGWAQINGRDELPIPVKVDFDDYYLRHRSFRLDLKILWLTIFSVASSKGVQH